MILITTNYLALYNANWNFSRPLLYAVEARSDKPFIESLCIAVSLLWSCGMKIRLYVCGCGWCVWTWQWWDYWLIANFLWFCKGRIGMKQRNILVLGGVGNGLTDLHRKGFFLWFDGPTWWNSFNSHDVTVLKGLSFLLNVILKF